MNNHFEDPIKKWFHESETHVPELVQDRINETLASLPNQPIKRGYWYKLGWVALTASIFISLVMGLGIVSPSFARTLENIPFLGSLFQTMLGDPGQKQASEEGYSSEINKSVTDKAITFTIQEIIYDGARLSIAYRYTLPSGMVRGSTEYPDWHFQVNGKGVPYGMGGNEQKVSNNQYAGVIDVSLHENLPDPFTIDILVRQVGDIRGKWKFSIPVSNKKAALVTKVFNTEVMKTFDNTTMTVRKVTFAPSTTEVMIDWSKTKDQRDVHDMVSFQVWDDKENLLQPLGHSGNGDPIGENWVTHYKVHLAPYERLPKYLIIRPIVEEIKVDVLSSVEQGKSNQSKKIAQLSKPPNTISRNISDGLPLQLSQGDIGKLTISKIEFLPDKTLVYSEAMGSDPYRQATTIWLENQDGESFHNTSSPLKDRSGSNGYVIEFPALDPNKHWRVVTVPMAVPNFIRELEVKVPLE